MLVLHDNKAESTLRYKGAATIDTNTRSCPPSPHKWPISCVIID